MNLTEQIPAIPTVEKLAAPVPRSFHASALLQILIDTAPADFFTLDWVIGNLPSRSFGVVILFMALLTLLPIISIPARCVIIFLAGQIILGHQSPLLPRRLLQRRFPSQFLTRLQKFAMPTLRQLEKIIRPRWCGLLSFGRQLNGVIVIVLAFTSLLVPIPLINMPVGVIVMMMAFGLY